MSFFYPPIALAILVFIYFKRDKYPFMLSFGQRVKRTLIQTALVGAGLVAFSILSGIQGRVTGHYQLISDHAIFDLMALTLGSYLFSCYRYHPRKASASVMLRSLFSLLIVMGMAYVFMSITSRMMNMAAALFIPALVFLMRGVAKFILGWTNVYQGVAVSPTHYLSKNLEIRLLEKPQSEEIKEKFSIYLRYATKKKHAVLVADLKKRYGEDVKPEEIVTEFEGELPAYAISSDLVQLGSSLTWGFEEKIAVKTRREVLGQTTVGGGTGLGMTTSGEMVFVSNPSQTVTHYGKTFTYKEGYGLFEWFLIFYRIISSSSEDNMDERQQTNIFVGYFDKRSADVLNGVLFQIKSISEMAIENENKRLREEHERDHEKWLREKARRAAANSSE